MIRYFAILLLFVSLIPRITNIAFYLDYKVNHQEYLQTCENKDKPDLKCDGKCHLKALFPDIAENKAENLPEEPTLKTTPEVLLFIDLLANADKSDIFKNLQTNINPYIISIKENLYFDFFVPPKFY